MTTPPVTFVVPPAEGEVVDVELEVPQAANKVAVAAVEASTVAIRRMFFDTICFLEPPVKYVQLIST